MGSVASLSAIAAHACPALVAVDRRGTLRASALSRVELADGLAVATGGGRNEVAVATRLTTISRKRVATPHRRVWLTTGVFGITNFHHHRIRDGMGRERPKCAGRIRRAFRARTTLNKAIGQALANHGQTNVAWFAVVILRGSISAHDGTELTRFFGALERANGLTLAALFRALLRAPVARGAYGLPHLAYRIAEIPRLEAWRAVVDRRLRARRRTSRAALATTAGPPLTADRIEMGPLACRTTDGRAEQGEDNEERKIFHGW